MEALNAKIENKEKKRGENDKKRGKKVFYSNRDQKPEFTKPKKDKAPCTGMCALMRQRTG